MASFASIPFFSTNLKFHTRLLNTKFDDLSSFRFFYDTIFTRRNTIITLTMIIINYNDIIVFVAVCFDIRLRPITHTAYL